MSKNGMANTVFKAILCGGGALLGIALGRLFTVETDEFEDSKDDAGTVIDVTPEEVKEEPTEA